LQFGAALQLTALITDVATVSTCAKATGSSLTVANLVKITPDDAAAVKAVTVVVVLACDDEPK
jgi:hypothetical protein